MSILASSRAISPLRSATALRRAVRTSRSSFALRILIAGSIGSLLLVSAALLANEIDHRAHPLLGWLTLFPLLAVIRVSSARVAALCGAVWGASLFFFLALQAHPLVPSNVVSSALLVGLPAAYAFGMVWVTRRFGFHPLILSFGWCGVELALLPLGLPGGLLGGIAGGSGGLLSFLEGFLGYVCMAALVVAVNAIVLSLLTGAYARVCASQRFGRGHAAEPRRRFIPRETPIGWHFFGHAARPRAPPVLAY